MRKCLAVLLALTLALSCLCASAQTIEAVRVVASPCHVRTGPGTDHRITGTLSTGGYYTWTGSVEYDSRGVAWYSIRYSGGLGWVSALQADLVTLSETSAPDEGDLAGTGARVHAEANLNVRTGPGLRYPAVGVLLSGQSVDCTGFQETDSRGVAWYQILYNGVACWVSSAYAVIR